MDHHEDNCDHLGHVSPPPPPPHKPLSEDQDVKRRPLVPFSFANGALKKHRETALPRWPRRSGWRSSHGNQVVYRECMKNHAASLGGHALDGCGEFMPSPTSNPAKPASLTCAACGCHRNFHRRVSHQCHRGRREEDGLDEEGSDDAGDEEEVEEGHSSSPPPPPQPAAASNQYCSSGPHMLMALSVGLPGGPGGSSGPLAATAPGGSTPGSTGSVLPRKRFRTKFSAEQKARMHELSERLGWRMQKRDEALVEQYCREIGVSRGVFKVWLHNNKHTFVGGPSSRRGAGGVTGVGVGGGEGGTDETTSYSEHGGAGGACLNGGSSNEQSGFGATVGDGGNRSSSGHVGNSSSLSP